MAYTSPVKGKDGVYRKATAPTSKASSIVSNVVSRVKNAGAVLGIATGLYNPNHDVIVANTPWQPVNKVMELFSNHPYTSAAVVTGAYYAAPYVAAGVTKAGAAITAAGAAGTAAVTLNTLKQPIIYGAAGLLTGGLISSMLNGGTKQTQDTQASQGTSQVTIPTQNTNQNPNNQTNPSQGGGGLIDISGSNNKVQYRQSQDTMMTYNYNATATPEQPIAVSAVPTMDLTPTQTATTSPNWLLIAGVAAGAYLLANNSRS